jgi:Catalase
MSNPGTALALGQEYAPANEAQAIAEIERISLDLLRADYQPHTIPAKRDAHAKHHGCVRAQFTVKSELPASLKVGVFREPRTFHAWVRFSNGARYTQNDGKGDTRGIAIKLLGVPGDKVLESERHEQTQDFTLVNHPVFAIRNAADYLELFHWREKGEKAILRFFFPGLNPTQWRLHEFGISRAINAKKISSPLDIQYWSMVPYKLGDQAIKYMVKPRSPAPAIATPPQNPHYLHEVMVNHLADREAVFDFFVQVQTDPVKMPVEDPTISWDEALSPFQPVATLTIPAQAFNSAEQMEFCEHLSYTPWHALPEHCPLGGINRVRRVVYEASARFRHDLNNMPYREPTEAEFMTGKLTF